MEKEIKEGGCKEERKGWRSDGRKIATKEVRNDVREGGKRRRRDGG